MTEAKEMVKEYCAEADASTCNQFFIKVTGSNGFMTGCSNWRDFEELIRTLRKQAIAEGYMDIKVSMTFIQGG